MPYVYILKCVDGTYYTGSTIDITRRFWEHQLLVGANYVKKRLPVELIYLEECMSIRDCFAREKQIQGWSRKKKEALIDSNLDLLVELSNQKK